MIASTRPRAPSRCRDIHALTSCNGFSIRLPSAVRTPSSTRAGRTMTTTYPVSSATLTGAPAHRRIDAAVPGPPAAYPFGVEGEAERDQRHAEPQLDPADDPVAVEQTPHRARAGHQHQ